MAKVQNSARIDQLLREITEIMIEEKRITYVWIGSIGNKEFRARFTAYETWRSSESTLNKTAKDKK